MRGSRLQGRFDLEYEQKALRLHMPFSANVLSGSSVVPSRTWMNAGLDVL